MKTKKLHKSSIRIGLVALLFFSVNAITGMLHAQDTFTWTGASNTDWATAGNWTKTSTAGTDTYPGQTRTVDYVVINNGGTPVLANNVSIGKLTVSNVSGASSGSTLTINNTYTLAISYTGSVGTSAVLLQGGNIVNNGTLNITTTTAATSLYGIICGAPSVAPGSATTYSYSGSGALSINTSAGTGASVYFNGADANSTYKISFPSSTTLTLPANTPALSVAANTISPVLISGTGFTLGSLASPVAAGILTQNGNGTNVTVDAGTTLKLYSLTGNTAKGVYLYFTTGGGSFTNNGNIYGYGTEGASFLQLTNSAGSGTNNLSFTNNGVISTDLVITATYAGVMNIVTQAANGTNTNTITNSGTLTLKNTSSTANAGYALYCGNTTPTSGSLLTTFSNSGTFELYGIVTSTGGKVGNVTFNNNSGGVVNMLNLGMDKVIFNNNSGATLDCKTNSITSNTTYAVSIKAGSTLKTASNNGLLCIAGTLPNGAVLDPAANYVFNGAAAQTLNSAGTSGAALTANNIEINNSFGLTLNNTTTVNGTLTLTSGKISLGTNDLTIGSNGSISGATSSNYIITAGLGKLNQTVVATVPTLFPIGASAASYDPANLTPSISTVISANVSSATLPATIPSGSYYHPRLWTLTSSVPSSTIIALSPSATNTTTGAYNVMASYSAGAYTNFAATVSSGVYTGTISAFTPLVVGTSDISTGLDNYEVASKSNIFSVNGSITVENSLGQFINIYSVTGSKIRSLQADSNKESVSIGRGIYLVTVGSKTQKIVVQ